MLLLEVLRQKCGTCAHNPKLEIKETLSNREFLQ